MLGESIPQILSGLNSRVEFDAFEAKVLGSSDVGSRVVDENDFLSLEGGEVLKAGFVEFFHDSSGGLGSVDGLAHNGAIGRAELSEIEGRRDVIEPLGAMVAHDAQRVALLVKSNGNLSNMIVAYDRLTKTLLELIHALSKLFSFNHRFKIHLLRKTSLQLERVPQITTKTDRKER